MSTSRKSNNLSTTESAELYDEDFINGDQTSRNVSENAQEYIFDSYDESDLTKLDFDSDNLLANSELEEAITRQQRSYSSSSSQINSAPNSWQDIQNSDWQDEPGVWDDDEPFS